MDQMSEIAISLLIWEEKCLMLHAFVEIDGQLVKVGLGVTSPLISCPELHEMRRRLI